DVLVRNDTGAYVVVEPADAPQLLAVRRIEGENVVVVARDDLGAVRRIDQHRRAPRGIELRRRSPNFLAVVFVQRHQAAALDAGVDDDQVLVQHRRVGRTPAVRAGADAGVPDFLAIEVQAIDARLAEEDEQRFAVAGDGAGGVAVLGFVATR